MNRLALLLIAASIVSLVGCDEIDVDWPTLQMPRHSVRPAAEPIRSRRATSQPEPCDGLPDIVSQPCYYQIVLTSDPVPPCSPTGISYIHVHCAVARDLGEAMAMIYLPSGASGSTARYTLIYALKQEWSSASPHVGVLDTARSQLTSSSDASPPFTCAVAQWYGVAAGDAETPQVKAAAALIERSANAAPLVSWDRWAGNMLAAAIYMEKLSDFDHAAQGYEKAMKSAEPGSLEYMTALYGQARALYQAGKMKPSHDLLDTLIAQFSRFRGSEPFERARRLISDMDRPR